MDPPQEPTVVSAETQAADAESSFPPPAVGAEGRGRRAAAAAASVGWQSLTPAARAHRGGPQAALDPGPSFGEDRSLPPTPGRAAANPAADPVGADPPPLNAAGAAATADLNVADGAARTLPAAGRAPVRRPPAAATGPRRLHRGGGASAARAAGIGIAKAPRRPAPRAIGRRNFPALPFVSSAPAWSRPPSDIAAPPAPEDFPQESAAEDEDDNDGADSIIIDVDQGHPDEARGGGRDPPAPPPRDSAELVPGGSAPPSVTTRRVSAPRLSAPPRAGPMPNPFGPRAATGTAQLI